LSREAKSHAVVCQLYFGNDQAVTDEKDDAERFMARRPLRLLRGGADGWVVDAA
jgi:hypothetical protein